MESTYVPIEIIAVGFTALTAAIGALWATVAATRKEDARRFDECLERERQQAERIHQVEMQRERSDARIEAKLEEAREIREEIIRAGMGLA